MTENTDTTTQPTPEPTEDELSAATEDSDADAGQQDGSKLAAEARSWRKKYQASKTEAETLTGTVAALQKQLVDHAIISRVADPDDFWSVVKLADLLDGNGTVDPARIATKLGEVLTAHPHWEKRTPPAAAPASEVTGNQLIGGGPEPVTTWAGLLGAKPK